MNLRNLLHRKPRPAGVDTGIWRLVAHPPIIKSRAKSLLTPADIRDRVFSAHRFREGYDMDEVDDYLDEVRVTVSRLALTCRSLSRQLESRQKALETYRSEMVRYRDLYRKRARREPRKGGSR